MPSVMPNKPCLDYFMRESAKNVLKKPQKNATYNVFKHMTIVFNSNHFNTIIYTNKCCVPNVMSIKQV